MTEHPPEDLLRLIPLYVAGSLSPQERETVRLAIDQSPELQAELEFWQGVAPAARARAAEVAQGHISSEHLVDLAEGDASLDPGRQRYLARHLESCSECRADYDRVRASLGLSGFVPTTAASPPRRALWRQRPVLVSLAICLLAVCVVWYPRSPREATVFLEYHAAVRSGEATTPAQLELLGSETKIRFQVEVPHSTLSGTFYTLSVDALPHSRPPVKSDSVQVTGRDLNVAHFTLGVTDLAGKRGGLRIVVAEVPPPGADLEPEFYEFQVDLIRR